VAHGFEDWTLSTTPTVITANKLNNGLDADKSASPEAGEVYYARDTKILYLCAVAGTWTGIDAASLVEGILTLYANMVGGGYKLTNIGAPTAATDAARKSEVDTVDAKLDDISVAFPSRASGTVYTNGNKIRVVAVSASVPQGASNFIVLSGYADWTATPTTLMVIASSISGNITTTYVSIVFILTPGMNYRVVASGVGTITINTWAEYDLF
jgi:hypothetical protein